MTGDELHRIATIAKAEAIIELLWAHLYDTEMAYHNDNGAQGYMGGMIRSVLDQMDGLMDEMVEREEVLDEPVYEVSQHKARLCGNCRYYGDGDRRVCTNKNSSSVGIHMEPYHYCGQFEEGFSNEQDEEEPDKELPEKVAGVDFSDALGALEGMIVHKGKAPDAYLGKRMGGRNENH